MQNLTEIDRNALENLRTYLRIPSVHPDVNYEPCVQLLKTLAEDIGLEFTVLRTKSDKPNVIITWLGSDTSLTSVMLNSHMDVVPASEGEWSYKPFNADIDENGNIYARGAQDVKSQGVQYLEAIRRLKLKKVQPKRNVHVTFVCDEEIGGEFGMKSLIKSDEFRKLRVGFAIDEAGVAEGETITVHQAERRVWVFKVNCIGSSGHGSVFVVNNAAEKVQSFLDNLYKFRTLQKVKNYEATTINLTKITGGYHSNVVPAKFSMVIDARIPNENFDEFEQLINRWCKEAGDGVTVEDYLKDSNTSSTKLDDSNLFWVALQEAAKKQNVKLVKQIPFGNTDGRYLRLVGVPTVGFTPNVKTSPRIHGVDEYLSVKTFLNGIKMLEEVILALANVP